MGDGFNAAPDDLRSHAQSVAGVGTSLDTCAEAAAEKRMGGQIYGVLFDPWLLPLLNDWADHLHGTISTHAELAGTISDGLKTNADLYDDVESHTKTQVKKSGEPGEGKPNPLIDESKPDGFASATSGFAIATDADAAAHDIFSEQNPLNALVDLASVGVDAWLTFHDPFGSLLAAGIGWLMEHIPGLKDWWEKLSGSPDEITTVATTWQNIGDQVTSCATTFSTLSTEIERWQGDARESYTKVANIFLNSTNATAMGCQGLGLVTNVAGGIVATLREIVYQLIKDFVEFVIIPAVLGALATAWCTFGSSIAVAITYVEIQADLATGDIEIQVTQIEAKVTILTGRAATFVSKLAKLAHYIEEEKKELNVLVEAAQSAGKNIGQHGLKHPVPG